LQSITETRAVASKFARLLREKDGDWDDDLQSELLAFVYRMHSSIDLGSIKKHPGFWRSVIEHESLKGFVSKDPKEADAAEIFDDLCHEILKLGVNRLRTADRMSIARALCHALKATIHPRMNYR